MIIRWLTGLIKGKKRREKAKVEIEELKKALLEDPKFRDEILRELEYRTGRRDLLKAGVLGLLGFTVGTVVGSEGVKATTQPVSSNPVNSNVARDIVSDYAVKIPKPCTCIVAQDGTGDYDVSPGEDASEVIQKAIDYAHEKGGGEIKIKDGKYIVKSRLAIPSNIWLIGSVNVEFEIVWGGYYSEVGYALITNKDYVNDGDENIRIENINFISNSDDWPIWEKGSRLFVFRDVKNVRIANCYFSHHGSGGELHIWGGKNIVLQNIRAIHNLARGLNVGDAVFKVVGNSVLVENCESTPSSINGTLAFNIAGQMITVRDCYGHDAISGCWIETSKRSLITFCVKIYGCYFENLKNEGIGVDGTTTQTKYITIENNLVRNSINNGILIGGCSNIITRSNIIENCGGTGIVVKASNNIVVGFNITRLCKCGIFLGGNKCTVFGNHILDCNEGVRISEGKYYSTIEKGMYNQIVENLIFNKASSSYAIYEGKSCDFNMILENNILSGKVIKTGKHTIVK